MAEPRAISSGTTPVREKQKRLHLVIDDLEVERILGSIGARHRSKFIERAIMVYAGTSEGRLLLEHFIAPKLAGKRGKTRRSDIPMSSIGMSQAKNAEALVPPLVPIAPIAPNRIPDSDKEPVRSAKPREGRAAGERENNTGLHSLLGDFE